MKPQWIIRPAQGTDLPFVYGTWLDSMWGAYRKGSGVRKTQFFTEYPQTLDSILERSTTSVAALSETPDVICGYITYEPKSTNSVYFIFVKQIFRKFGIGTALYKHAKGTHGKTSTNSIPAA